MEILHSLKTRIFFELVINDPYYGLLSTNWLLDHTDVSLVLDMNEFQTNIIPSPHLHFMTIFLLVTPRFFFRKSLLLRNVLSLPGPPRRGGVGHLMSSLGNRTETRHTVLKDVDDKILNIKYLSNSTTIRIF